MSVALADEGTGMNSHVTRSSVLMALTVIAFVVVQRNKFRCYKIGRADGTGSGKFAATTNVVGVTDLVTLDFSPGIVGLADLVKGTE